MDSWAIAAALLSGATLLVVLWQVLRTETREPPRAWHVRVTRSGIVEDGRRTGNVAFSPMAGYVAHAVELHTWGGTAAIEVETRGRMDSDSEPITVDVNWQQDRPAFVGLTWFRATAIRRRPVRMGIRVRLHSDGELERWRWVRRPRWLGGTPPGRWVSYVAKPQARTGVPPE